MRACSVHKIFIGVQDTYLSSVITKDRCAIRSDQTSELFLSVQNVYKYAKNQGQVRVRQKIILGQQDMPFRYCTTLTDLWHIDALCILYEKQSQVSQKVFLGLVNYHGMKRRCRRVHKIFICVRIHILAKFSTQYLISLCTLVLSRITILARHA